MTVKNLPLTLGLENTIIAKVHHQLGIIPCHKCGQRIAPGKHRRLIIRSCKCRHYKSCYYHSACARLVKLI